MPTTAQLTAAVQPIHHQKERGPCTLLTSGLYFYPQDPREEEIQITDIAHSLSMQCRYNGHVPSFYSVAQHSVLCAMVADYLGYSHDTQLEALLHDSAEAYISDLPRPVKLMLPDYYELEDGVQKAVAAKYGIEHPMSLEVKAIDNRMLHTEARDLGLDFNMIWGGEGEGPYEFLSVEPWTPQVAEARFLDHFNALT